MKLLVLLFSVILYADLTAAASMEKDLSQVNTTKSSDLVSLLQEDLRKNNDDYKDIVPNLRDSNAIKTKLQNPYLLDGDAILSGAENTGDNKLDPARRSNNDERKSTNKTPMSSTTKIRTNDKDVVHGTSTKKDIKKDNTDGKNKKNDSKNIKTQKTEKVKNNSYEKFMKNHRIDKPQSDKKENLRQDIKNKKDERTTKLSTSYVATKAFSKIWKTHEESKMKNKNLMLHDKNMKINNKNMKLRLQDTGMDDKKSRHVHHRKSLDFDWGSKASREGEVMDPTTERLRHMRNDSRRGSIADIVANANKRTNALHAMLDQEGLLNKFLKQIGREGARAFELESDIEATTPAVMASAELDMLPATGERVETLRRKGRFCFRHVLFPEGPKYDSRGRIYEPAHEKKISFKDFASTKKPRQVLPRCCNCCKKSVLGCE